MARVVITSDWHLGHRRFPASVGGRNAHELDVERAVERAVDETVRYWPDLILIAGDTFDHARPSFFAVRAWQRAVRRFITETDAHVVIVLGNHEATKSADALSPVIVVEGEPRVHIAAEPKRIRLHLHAGQTVSIACFPFSALTDATAYSLAPDPNAELQVVLMHAAVRSSAAPGLLPAFYSGETALDVGREAARFDIIALGDFHGYRQLVPGRCVVYPGSLERVSSNLWDEPEPKGIVTYDTDTRELRFLEIPTRPVHSFDLVGLSAGVLNEYLRALLAKAEPVVRDAIVRVVVEDFERADRDQIDWAIVRQLKSTALHFELSLRYAERAALTLGDRRESRGRTIQEAAAEFLAGEPAEVRACAMEYLGAEVAA